MENEDSTSQDDESRIELSSNGEALIPRGMFESLKEGLPESELTDENQSRVAVPLEAIAKLLEPNQEVTMEVKEVKRMFSGPCPDPETMKGYQKIDPSFPSRIFQQFELNSEHKRELNHLVVAAEIEDKRNEWRERRLGQWLGFIIALIGLASSVLIVCFTDGAKAIGGSILGGTSLVALAGLFVYSSKNQVVYSSKNQANERDLEEESEA